MIEHLSFRGRPDPRGGLRCFYCPKKLEPLVTKNRGNIFYSMHIPIARHTWIEACFETLKCDNFDSNVLLLQDPNKHLSMGLNTMDHKGSGIHLDFFFRSQHVVLCG
jgi:hypothetical protein